jgi:N-methylhydantoinase B
MDIDVNLLLDTEGAVRCRHCDTVVGTTSEPFAHAVRRERDSRDAGPGVREDPAEFSDRAVMLRQRFCPGCLTVLSTEIVPRGEDEIRGFRVGIPTG